MLKILSDYSHGGRASVVAKRESKSVFATDRIEYEQRFLGSRSSMAS
jgi:hypothetical protein